MLNLRNLSSFLDDRLIIVSINHAITITILQYYTIICHAFVRVTVEMCTTYE